MGINGTSADVVINGFAECGPSLFLQFEDLQFEDPVFFIRYKFPHIRKYIDIFPFKS
jgi:hypothetical protein